MIIKHELKDLVSIFKNVEDFSNEVSEKLAKVMKNPRRALETVRKIGRAAVSKKPTAAPSTIPDVLNFYHTRKRKVLGKFVKIQVKKTI